MAHVIRRLAATLLAVLALPLAGAPPIPRVQRAGGMTRLLVDGEPYLILGGQVRNSTTSSPEELAKALDILVGMHANVAEIPLYWEALEPSPGRFDFSQADRALAEARKRGLRVVFLWFATWKNGESHYAPEWVKRDPVRYPRVTDALGRRTAILSPLGKASREADARAFAALMAHLGEADQAQRTVLMVQVENEPGFLGTDRDYGAEAARLFGEPVPAALLAGLRARSGNSASLAAALKASADRTRGTWRELFGDLAAEAFTAWQVAAYVEQVASAGKLAYPLPLYVNVWLVEGEERAGRWPSGGATEHVMDIWKLAAPSIDILAPDIYYPKFHDAAAAYTRPDNPLWVPETNFIPYFSGFPYLVLGEFAGIGISPFAVDDVAKGGASAAIGAQWEEVYGVLAPLLPLIARHQGSGRIHPLLQGTAAGEDWKYAVRLGGRRSAVVNFTATFNPETGRARGMILELDADTFLVAGNGFNVTFRELDGPFLDSEILSIEEGTFKGLAWVPSKRRNGDERHVSLPERSTTLLVRLNP